MNKEIATVIVNSLYLYVLQFVNLVTPLILIPLIISTLGIDLYGSYIWLLSIASILAIVNDYGYSMYGVNKVSKNRGDKEYCSILFSEILYSKIIILSITILVIITVGTIKKASLDQSLIFCLFVISQAFNFSWFFQAIEKMFFITLTTALNKLIVVCSVYLIIGDKSQIKDIIFILSVSNIISSCLYIYLYRKNGFALRLGRLETIFKHFKNAFSFFMARLSLVVITSGVIFLLGYFGTVRDVAFYSIGEKIFVFCQSIIFVASQALFPYINRTKDIKLLNKFIFVMGIIIISGIIILYFFRSIVFDIIFNGAVPDQSYTVYNVFLCTIFFNAMSIYFGYSAFSAINKIAYVNYTVISGALICLLAIFSLIATHNFNALSAACTILMVECLVLLSRLIYLKKFGYFNDK